MKTIHRSLLTALLGVASISLAAAQGANEVKPKPSGQLSATTMNGYVKTGDKVTLNWNITYPPSSKPPIDRKDNDTFEAKEELLVDVRVLGMSYQISEKSWGTVHADIKVSGSEWGKVIETTQDKVNPAKKYVESLVVPAGATIDFRGCGHNGQKWLPYRQTGASTTPQNVVALYNGDPLPTTTPAFNQGRIEDFLTDVINKNTKTVKIGPRDVIYLIEIGQTDPKTSGFDLQDLVLLVTYNTRVKNNNGHGNNLDGVDSSNPGQGKGGPTGSVDPSGTLDDERPSKK